MRATLEHVLTDAAFKQMIAVADHFTAGVRDVIAARRLPWTITQLGARAEYRFCPAPPRTGGESDAAADPLLDEYLHLYTVNRGVLMTPFHNMALMSPATTEADVDVHTGSSPKPPTSCSARLAGRLGDVSALDSAMPGFRLMDGGKVPARRHQTPIHQANGPPATATVNPWSPLFLPRP